MDDAISRCYWDEWVLMDESCARAVPSRADPSNCGEFLRARAGEDCVETSGNGEEKCHDREGDVIHRQVLPVLGDLVQIISSDSRITEGGGGL